MGPAAPLRAALAVVVGLGVAPPSLPAQAAAAGRVVLPRPRDTVPVPRIRVVLHRVGRDVQGPIDSAVTDARGRFRFSFHTDTSAIYLLSARYGGIEYFSPPLRSDPARPDTALSLAVYDTSSGAPVTVEARHIIVPRAGEDGARSVLDLIVLRNDGLLARVSPDSAHPSWSMALPPDAAAMEVRESDVSPEAVVRIDDSVHVLAPLAPGQKQLSLEYALPPTRLDVAWPIGPSGALVNLLVEERGVRVSGGLVPVDSQVIEGRTFQRWKGNVPPGGVVRLVLRSGAKAPWPVLGGMVAAVAAALTFAAWRLLRRPPAAGRVVLTERERLLDAIAALDARYLDRETAMPADEWQRYLAERAALKARLEDTLAAPETSR